MSHIDLTCQTSVAVITLSRPQKLNAITPEMLSDIEAAVAEAEGREGIRAIVIRGEGRCFSVGADIDVWSALPPEAFRTHWIVGGHRAFGRLAACRLPVIAALHGMALGGGLELALAADLRVADEGTMLGLPEVSLGTVPGWGGTQRLPELIGLPRAKQMLLTAERITAARAETWGLVNEIAAQGGAFDRACEIAARISELAPVSVEVTKAILDGHRSAQGGAGLALEMLAGMATATTNDVKEGIAALREKRPPRFQGR